MLQNYSDTCSEYDSYYSSDNESIDGYDVKYLKNKNEPDLTTFFTKKEICYYKMIDKFFLDCGKDYISKMVDIINGKSDISLRVLDWFVTKYSKKRLDGTKKESFLIIPQNGNRTEVFDIRISYKSQLKAYRKRYFDPFRRRKKFKYYYDTTVDRVSVDTTLGQLNFFKWAISNDIIRYVEKNIKQITYAMNQSNKDDKKKKQDKISSDGNSSGNKKEISIGAQVIDKSEIKIGKVEIRKQNVQDKSVELNNIENKIKINNTIKSTKLSNNHLHLEIDEDDSVDISTRKKNKQFNKDIKINAIKITKNDEIEIILTFD